MTKADKLPSPKTDSAQLIIMLSAFSVFSALVLGADDLTETILRAFVQAVLVIPAVMLAHKLPGKNIIAAAYAAGKPFGIILSVLYALFFAVSSAYFLMEISLFSAENYYPEGGALVCVFIIGIAAAYAACCGMRSVFRMSTVLLLIFVPLIIILVTAALLTSDSSGFSAVADYSGINREDTFCDVSNIGLALLLFAPTGTKDGKTIRCGAFGSAAAMLGVSALLGALCRYILGDFIKYTEYPFYSAVKYAFRDMDVSPDGFWFVFWIMVSAAVISLLLSACGEGLSAAFSGQNSGRFRALSILVCACIALVLAAVSIAFEDSFTMSLFALSHSTAVITAILAVFPLLVFAFCGKEKTK